VSDADGAWLFAQCPANRFLSVAAL